MSFQKTVIQSSFVAPPVGPYSQAIEAGAHVFASGQIPINSRGQIVEGSIEIQTEQVLKNLEEVFKAANVSLEQVVKTTVFLKDMNDFSKMNEVYSRFFSKHPPARSTIAVLQLPKNARIEIEAIAYKG